MFIPRPRSEPEYAVYLMDPGGERRRLIGLLREVTGSSLETCAYLARHVPALVARCPSPEAADRIVSRFRDLGAVAAIRPADEAMEEEPRPAELPSPAALRPILWFILALALLQVPVAAWWIATGRLLAGISGLFFAA